LYKKWSVISNICGHPALLLVVLQVNQRVGEALTQYFWNLMQQRDVDDLRLGAG
jgi:hypothetical protein